jgi:recombination protein RecA
MSRSREAATILRGLAPPRVAADAPRFCLAETAGRLVELSGDVASCVLTLAMGLILDAQAAREPVAWVGSDESSFYPPDAAESGVDLAALVVVRLALAQNAPAPSKRPTALAVAAERLLRSGAFGLVVIDLGKEPVLAQPLQTRLLGLAQRHQTALLCLTEKSEESGSLGSLVSLRAHAVRHWLARERFVCELRVGKDKRRGPVWSEREVCRGPLGLR